jgi:hypothetical protein
MNNAQVGTSLRIAAMTLPEEVGECLLAKAAVQLLRQMQRRASFPLSFAISWVRRSLEHWLEERCNEQA